MNVKKYVNICIRYWERKGENINDQDDSIIIQILPSIKTKILLSLIKTNIKTKTWFKKHRKIWKQILIYSSQGETGWRNEWTLVWAWRDCVCVCGGGERERCWDEYRTELWLDERMTGSWLWLDEWMIPESSLPAVQPSSFHPSFRRMNIHPTKSNQSISNRYKINKLIKEFYR